MKEIDDFFEPYRRAWECNGDMQGPVLSRDEIMRIIHDTDRKTAAKPEASRSDLACRTKIITPHPANRLGILRQVCAIAALFLVPTFFRPTIAFGAPVAKCSAVHTASLTAQWNTINYLHSIHFYA